MSVVRVAAVEIKPTHSFTARVEAKDKVELRARIEGFLEQRAFTEGADVKAGDLLFVIEKGLYRAAVEEAQGALEKARATLKLAEIDVDRQTQLVQRNVAAQAVLDQVTARLGEARGALLAQNAALEKAQLQLGYTEIRAPIAGRISRASVSVGAFVAPASGALATIVRQDPIYATFPVSQRDILDIRNRNASAGAAKRDAFVVHAVLADASRYGQPGKLDFIDVTINQGTDTVLVRASFANPDRILVDGALVNVVVESGAAERALRVAQQALQVDQSGAYVLVVDKESKVRVRRVELGRGLGAQVIVSKGLEADDLVITEGIQKVRPGQVVEATEVKPGA
ncbi:MAG: efflux RND transporter periplasmic adaptor subunit [Proteobacteria bacterium]|nr:efflux RND transporter periplasmic adaptor subunit [Pseudomonadota bacterium]